MYHKWQSYDIWFLRYQLQQIKFFLSSWAISPPPPPTAQKMKISKNREKYLEISTFYTSAPKIMIICYTVLEIWCMADVIVVFHFGQFLPFYPSNSPKNGNFTKMKKTPEDIFILHNCTKNYDCSLHCYWDREHDGCNCYFSFWASFCPFTPLKPWKMKISKKRKKHLEISSLYTSAPKMVIICCTVLEIWHVMDVIVAFHFGQFFVLLTPPNSPKIEHLKKMKKKTWRYHHFTQLCQKLWL